MFMNTIKMKVYLDTSPDVPDKNGIVYTKDVLDKIISEMMNRHTYIPVLREDYDREFVSSNDPNKLDIDKFATKAAIYGKVADMNTEYITLDIDMWSCIELREYLDKGYKINIVYNANIENNTVVEFYNILYLSLQKY